MKKFYFLKIMMAVVLTMLVTVGNVFADRGWVQVTYNSNLSVGDTVVIAALTMDKAMGTQSGNNRYAVNIVRSGDMITSIGSAQIFVVHAGNEPGTFAFFDPNQGSNGGYLYAAGTGNSNYLRTKDTLDNEGRSNWLISFSEDGAIESIVAQTTATARKIMRYNSTSDIFSCYGSGQQPITLYRYEDVQIAVAAPEFSLAAGSFTEPQTVSISCATAGATILYTTNGSNPATNGQVYSTPLTISATTTVKAVAFLGIDTSFLSEVTYIFPFANIADFKMLHADNTSNTISDNNQYDITGDVTYVFRSGRYMYVKDATAGLLIYDYNNPVITNEYSEGDVISGGLHGKYSKYNGQIEFVPSQNPAASTQNTGAVLPTVVNIADLLANYNNYDAQLITLENVVFSSGFTGSETTIEQGSNSLILYNRFSIDTTLPAGTVTNVTGFVGKFNNAVQIYPRYNSDLSAASQQDMPSLTVTLNGEQFSTLDTLQVTFDIQNFTLGTDGLLKLESELLTTMGLTNPAYMNDQLLAMFLAQTFSPLPAGAHTVTASLVDMTQAALTPAVSQTVTFTVTAPVVATPVISPDAGMYTDSVVVTMTCATPGAQIRYTIAGEEPSTSSTLYEGPFTLNSSRTVKAKAFMNNVSWEDSPVAEAAYTIVSGPTLTVDPTSLAFGPNALTSTVNIYSASLTDPITISCNNNDFQLSATTFPANVGNTSFTVTYTGFGPAFGMVTVSSGTLSATIDLVATAQLPAPEFSPVSGTTDTLIAVVMTDDVQGASISYTIDGTDPDVNSPVYTPGYSQPIVFDVPGIYTVKAFAFLEGWGNSEIATATYTVVEPVVPSIDTIMYSVGFEASEGFTATQTYNNTNIVYTGAEGQQWGTVYGTPATNDHICGAQSMQMRWYTSAASTFGYTFTNFDIRNVTYVTFDAKSPNGLKLNVSYSIDGGNTYVGDSLYTIAASGRHNYRFNVSETGEYNFVRLKFALVLPSPAPSGTSKLVIDSVVVFGVPGIEVNVVETPVITPNGGTYYNAFDATISCATDNAVIRYTLDGTEPTETSSEYSAPISINTTTTLKAKAWKEGYTPSFVTSVTYTFPPEVSNIAAFKAVNTENVVYKITGDVNFVFRSGNYMFIEDESAALMIYDQQNKITTTYNEGDVISGGIFGKYKLYDGVVEMIPDQNTPAATGTPVTITPMVATIPTLVSQYSTFESRLVTIENVTFIGNEKFVNGTDTLQYYNRFSTVTNNPEAGETGSITGFLAMHNSQVQLYPRDDNDFSISPVMEQVATPVFTPAAGEYENSVEVSFSCTTVDATIYYTLDGTDPDATATEYTTPFTLTATTTVKAIALKDGMLNSEVVSATYIINTVGIHDLQQQVSIYPNPTSGDVTLDLSGLNAKTVELFSMNGQLLNIVVPTDETMTLSLSQYANGIYFVRIHSDKGVTTQKIVKK